MSLGKKVPKLIGIIFGVLFIFCIGCLLWQYYKYYILFLDDVDIFGNWILSCITAMITTVFFSVDSIIALCKIKRSKQKTLDILLACISFTLLLFLLPFGGSADIYNTFWLIFVFVLVILEIISFFLYIVKEG